MTENKYDPTGDSCRHQWNGTNKILETIEPTEENKDIRLAFLESFFELIGEIVND